MKKRILILTLCAMLTLTFASCATPGAAPGAPISENPGEMSIAISHQPQNHGLPSYIAEQEGYFEKAGLKAEIIYFTGGAAQSEALGANAWDVGVMGVPPAASSGMAYDAKIIGFAAEDTMACDYWVRKDSDIAKISGAVPECPQLLGDADSWRGKVILCPTGSSAHYLLMCTLDLLGLTESDVQIVHMDVPAAFAAFKAGQGDICALWDPQSKLAAKEDWVMVSAGEWTGSQVYNVIVASDKAIKEKPDAVLAWLKTYYQVCEDFKDNKAGQIKHLLTLQRDNGLDVNEEIVTSIVNERPMPTIADQAKLWDGEYGQRQVDQIVYRMLDFFVKEGKFEQENIEYLKKINFLDDTFIKQLINK